MRLAGALIAAGAIISSTSAFAADYRAGYYEPGVYSAPRAVYVPYVPPVYYLPSPPQYVQDLRTGEPGHWVQFQPSFLDRLFIDLRNGY
jgi:hypothetical protein